MSDGARDRAAWMERALSRARARARGVLVGSRALDLAAAAVVTGTLLALADYTLRLPSALRGVLLAAGLAALAVAAWRWVRPALFFRPALTSLALRLEQRASDPALQGSLASAFELAMDAQTDPAVRESMAPRLAAAPQVTLVNPRRFIHASSVLAIATLPALFATLATPHLAAIGARRVLTPWASPAWPQRTTLEDATGLAAHPLGVALPLRAAAVTTLRDASRLDVRAGFRIVRAGRAGPVREILLNPQGPGEGAPGWRFEGLVEPAWLAPGESGASADEEEAQLEYWFEADDARTEPARLALAQPPAVVSAEALVTPPAYAAAYLVEGRDPVTGRRELSVSADRRAALGPILAGSTVRLRLAFNKPVPGPGDGPDAQRLLLESAFPGASLPADLSVAFEPAAWQLTFTLREPLALPVVLTDRFGIRSADVAAFRFDTVDDAPPTVAIVEPGQDQAVLPSAVLPVAAEARDDVGLDRLELRAQRQAPEGRSGGGALAPSGEPVALAEVRPAVPLADPGAEPATRARASAELQIASLNAAPGDEVWITGAASDTVESEGARRAPTISAPRRLRIIGEGELLEQLRRELAVVRRAATQIDADQARLMRDAEPADPSGAAEAGQRAAEAQSGLGQRLRAPLELLEEVGRRIEQNRLADEAVREVTQRARELVAQAGRASDDAAQAIRDAARAGQPDARQAGRDDQQEVRDSLEGAIEALEQGQEGWLARRSVEKLLEEQRALSGRTAEAASRTAGRSVESLQPAERAELDRLSQEQLDLARRSEQVSQELRQRADRAEAQDQALAEALRRAARQAQEAQLARRQQQASEQIGQNQTGQAARSQEQAGRTLEQMARELERAARRRDAVLSRRLADLVQTLEALIASQQEQIAALAAAAGGADPGGLDAPMRTLHARTLAAAESIAGERAMEPVAELVSAAGDAQAQALVHLRAEPPALDPADTQERLSLQKLTEARDTAVKLQEEAQRRDASRRRAELADSYRAALAEQKALNADTEPLLEQGRAGGELDRRQRLRARELGERQGAVQRSLQELAEKTTELAEAAVFTFAHQRLDESTGAAASALGAGSAGRDVARNQAAAVTVLAGLVEALGSQEDDNPFREEEQSGGGGGQGQGGQQAPPLVPELAELRLLRLMQQEAAQRTRDVAALGAGDADAQAEARAVAALQRALSRQAEALLEKLQRPESPPLRPGVPGPPAPEPDPQEPAPAPQEPGP